MAVPTIQARSTAETAPPGAVVERKVVPLKWWAAAGALILAFSAYVMISWVTGPYFERVPTGPSDPPTYMKVAGIVFQAISWPIALGLIYWFAVRPWRRERSCRWTACS